MIIFKKGTNSVCTVLWPKETLLKAFSWDVKIYIYDILTGSKSNLISPNNQLEPTKKIQVGKASCDVSTKPNTVPLVIYYYHNNILLVTPFNLILNLQDSEFVKFHKFHLLIFKLLFGCPMVKFGSL